MSASLVLAIPLASLGQGPSVSTDQSVDEETVYLSPFEVSAERVTGYRVTDSASARVRRALIDTPATINVISSEFVTDIAASSILDATQYISGMSTPVLGGVSGVNERQNLRGFETFASTVDSFTGLGAFSATTDPYLMERIEVFKGPNAIINPNGAPGGSTNLVTKSPKFEEPAHVVRLELADQHYGSRMGLDSTGRIPGTERFAYRIVSSYRDAKAIVPGRLLNKTINPMLTWAISDKTQIKFKGFLFNWGQTGAQAANANNLRLRHDVPHGKVISLADIMPGYEIGKANGNADWTVRENKVRRGTVELLSAIGEHLNLRAAALQHYSHTYSNGGSVFTWCPGEWNARRVNPETGEYSDLDWQLQDPSLPWDEVTNRYVGSPIDYSPGYGPTAYGPAAAWARESYNHDWARESHYQVDLAGKWDFGHSSGDVPLLTLNAVAGTSRSRNWTNAKSYEVEEDPLPGYDFSKPFLPNGHLRRTKTLYYAHGQVDTLRGRLLISGGLSYQERNYRGNYNRLTGSVGSKADGSKKSPSYAVLYKITPWASVYGSYSTNAEVQGVNASTGEVSLWSDGKQKEGGLKFEFFNRRLSVTTAYYELKKTNVPTPDPMKWLFPDLPDSLADITNEGIEFDIVGQVTANLTILGSYTDMKMRDELGRRRQNIPDTMYNALLRYTFSNSPVKGLSVYIGFTHSGESAGENGNGTYTSRGVLIQPSFYLPSRTVYNAGASYSFGQLSLQLNVENLLDKEEVAISGGRHAIGWLPERNIRLTTTYSF